MKQAVGSKKSKLLNNSEVALSIAMLEQQVEQTTERFEVLGDKFDRILSKVEELALHTATLNTRHDTQIQVLQKQMAGTEAAIGQMREEMTNMTTRITDQVGKEISDALQKMSSSIQDLSKQSNDKYTNLDNRIQSLERWRMLLIGGGIVAGAAITRVIDIILDSLSK